MDDEEFGAVSRHFEKIDAARALDSAVSLRSLDEGDQAFAVLYACDGLIGNGGFAGLFQNPSGNVAGLLPWAAARLHLPQHQEIAASALTVVVTAFGSEYPENFDARWDRWTALSEELGDKLDDRLGELDEQWYAADDGLQRALIDHARSRA